MAEWTVNSNEALSIRLVRTKADEDDADKKTQVFHPTFTYPIVGEEELVYGYRDLVIDLRFASGSLAHHLSISYSSQIEAAETADNVEEIFSKFLPLDACKDESEFLERVEHDASHFTPLGEKIHSYTRRLNGKGKNRAEPMEGLDSSANDVVEYEVYHATWSTQGFREYHRRMQIFILFYIEGGSYIQEDEESWEFVLLYEKRKRPDVPGIYTYHFIGYSSLYPFYCFPDLVRMRLSQFVILPPYQHLGHGCTSFSLLQPFKLLNPLPLTLLAALYNAIYNYVLTQPRIADLSVEDPAEAFEDLRDRNDLRMLLNHQRFCEEGYGEDRNGGGGKVSRKKAKGKLRPPVDRGWIEKWRKELKIAGRQFSRLVEMLVLKELDPLDERALRAYRLQVKERLYRFNFQLLAQVDKEERHEKLESTYQSVIEDYGRILAMIF